MGIEIYQVDAFTDKPFAGNPAAVCLLLKPAGETWMQAVAREMNLSETAFLYRQDQGFQLRWFTPEVEVDLCGHATLASAHILWEAGWLSPETQARFFTKSGLLTAERQDQEIILNFPATPAKKTDIPDLLGQALGVQPRYFAQSQYDYLVEVEAEETVRKLTPNMTQLKTFPVRGIIVTSLVDSGEYDFVSRFFAPGVGIDEDPVTGSAHCCLGPFWGQRLQKDEMLAYQASSRGGTLRVRLVGDRVHLGGHAVTVLKGELV